MIATFLAQKILVTSNIFLPRNSNPPWRSCYSVWLVSQGTWVRGSVEPNVFLSSKSYHKNISSNSIQNQGRLHEQNPGKTKSLVIFEPFVLQTFTLHFWKRQLKSKNSGETRSSLWRRLWKQVSFYHHLHVNIHDQILYLVIMHVTTST